MITKNDLHKIYEWARVTTFPLKKAPTIKGGYCNKDVYISWLKGVGKQVTIRKKLMTDEIFNIFSNEDILYATYSSFSEGTILNPHRDPPVYRERYKRIQLPLSIPDKVHCFMIWDGKKVTWREGIHQVFPVMDVIHEGYNLSTKNMNFVMIDVKMDTQVENAINL